MIKKNIVVIHGGRTFDNYKEYINSLKSREVNVDDFKHKNNWRNSLENRLGKNYEVLVPRMPNSNNSVYEEWKIWFEKITPFVKNDVILIGHSLGGIFLAKYLAENNYKKKIKALFLVAAPHSDCTDEPLGKFTLPKSLIKISSQVKKIYLIHSKDDPVVPFTELEKYKKHLPEAKEVIFKNKGHFNQETLPELVKILKNL